MTDTWRVKRCIIIIIIIIVELSALLEERTGLTVQGAA